MFTATMLALVAFLFFDICNGINKLDGTEDKYYAIFVVFFIVVDAYIVYKVIAVARFANDFIPCPW